MSVVNVAGIVDMEAGAHGLHEAMAEFNDHEEKRATALLNLAGVGIPEDKKADAQKNWRRERPAYDPNLPENQWPRMLYHADGRQIVIGGDKEEKAAVVKGFRREPYPVIQIAIEDPKVEKKMLQDQLREKDGKIATLSDQLERLIARMDESDAKKK